MRFILSLVVACSMSFAEQLIPDEQKDLQKGRERLSSSFIFLILKVTRRVIRGQRLFFSLVVVGAVERLRSFIHNASILRSVGWLRFQQSIE
jgi:hypothetical protein